MKLTKLQVAEWFAQTWRYFCVFILGVQVGYFVHYPNIWIFPFVILWGVLAVCAHRWQYQKLLATSETIDENIKVLRRDGITVHVVHPVDPTSRRN